MNGWSIKKEVFLHILSTLVLVVLVSILKFLYAPNFIVLFSLGATLGMILPDVDHLIYAFFLHPTDLSSQRIKTKVETRHFLDGLFLLYTTRDERRDLIFHNLFFVAIFIIFSFLVVSSSNSLLGRGLVISFLVHLLVDQIRDIQMLKNPNSWFKYNVFNLTENKLKVFFAFQFIFILLLAFVF